MRVVGKIIGAHGIKGELKVFPLLDDTSLFNEFELIEYKAKSYKVENVRSNKNLILLKLEGVDDRDSSEQFHGEIKAELNEELANDEFYIDDLIGLGVKDHDGNNIGSVTNFSDSGQELLFIKLNDSFEAKRDLIVPFVEEYIMSISLNDRVIQIKLNPDLLELVK